MKKARWMEKSTLQNELFSKNNLVDLNLGWFSSPIKYNIDLIHSVIRKNNPNVIMTNYYYLCYFIIITLLLFSCFDSAAAKSLDIPMANNYNSVDKLAPPDHLDGIKMEQDGHLNNKFHQEVFLGDLEDFEDIPYEKRRSKLDEVFKKADINEDENLDFSELEAWIKKKLEEHFHEAADENDRIFKTLDTNKDGYLDWDEYLRMYLLARGYGRDKIDKYMKDINRKTDLKYNEEERFFNEGDKDVLLRYKNRWELSDIDKTDNKLSKEEFLKFRHPEHRDDSMLEMAESIVHALDKDSDGNVTMEEFVALPPGIPSDTNTAEDVKWQNERKKEFIESIDMNHDGIVNLNELKAYLDPRNPIQIKNEATAILEMIDDDYNGKLSKEEVQRHETEFIYSKMVETARNFHDEF